VFIGHVPAGYLLTRALWSTLYGHGPAKCDWKQILYAGLVGSLLPDSDMVYFYVIDHRQHLHHSYWTHMPVFWIVIGLLALLCIALFHKKRFLPYVAVGEAGIFLHLFLDTIVGKVRWLYPLSSRDFFLFTVPAVHGWYVWNFFLHWTFLFEILAWIAASYVYVRYPLVADAPDAAKPHVRDCAGGAV
jgi:inner membrane protein